MSALSFILISGGRINHLTDCISSIAESATENRGRFSFIELIVVSDSETLSALSKTEYSSDIMHIRLFEMESASKSSRRNYGIHVARGEILYFLDDDTVVKKDFIEIIFRKFADEDISVIGGPNINHPDSEFFERLQGYVLASAVGAFSMSKRYSSEKEDRYADQKELILCNLGIRKKILVKEQLGFDEHLHYNEENHLLSQLSKKGYKFMYTPALAVYHRRRSDLASLFKQVFNSGFGRAVSIKLDPDNFSAVYMIPSICVIYSVLFPLFVGLSPVFIVPYILYFMLLFFTGTAVFFCRENKLAVVPLVMLLIVFCHTAYGLGLLFGIQERL